MKKSILAIGPHPDDIEIGCGGTLIKLSEKFDIQLLIMTEGSVGGENRKKEQIESGKLLNASKIWWGGYEDTQIPYSKELIDYLESVIKEVEPAIIFANFYRDTHQDHRAVANNLQSATRYVRNVLFYEVPTSIDFNPTIFMDIGDVWKKKQDLLRAHTSQINATRVRGLSILESSESCAIFRGFQGRVKYAEAFLPLRFSLDWSLDFK